MDVRKFPWISEIGRGYPKMQLDIRNRTWISEKSVGNPKSGADVRKVTGKVRKRFWISENEGGDLRRSAETEDGKQQSGTIPQFSYEQNLTKYRLEFC